MCIKLLQNKLPILRARAQLSGQLNVWHKARGIADKLVLTTDMKTYRVPLTKG